MTRDLSAIVKAYDVRGLCPGELDADIARALGAAFARFAGSDRIVTARDMRETGVELSRAQAQRAVRPRTAAMTSVEASSAWRMQSSMSMYR